MKISRWSIGIAGVAAAGLLAASLVTGAGAALADGPNDPTAYEQALAAKLGLSIADLQAAQKTAADQTIDDATASGRLTQTDATRLKSIDGNGLRRGGFLRRTAHGAGHAVGHLLDDAAQAIGISRKDVKSGLQSGQSLTQIAAAHGVSRDQLKQGMTTSIQGQIQQGVANGHITQQQADKINGRLSTRLDGVIDRSGRGGRGGHGGKQTQPQQPNQAPPQHSSLPTLPIYPTTPNGS